MKNKVMFVHATEILRKTLDILALATIKQSDVPQVVEYLGTSVKNLKVPEGKIVHWDNAQLEPLTSLTIELHRQVLSIGREVNRVRVGQKKVIKNFVKEATRSDEMIELQKRNKEVQDAYKGSKT